MMTVHFYNYLAAVEVQPQSVATPTHKFTGARYSFDRCCTTSGTNVNRPGQILQIRDCPGDSGTVGAYGSRTHAERLEQSVVSLGYPDMGTQDYYSL